MVTEEYGIACKETGMANQKVGSAGQGPGATDKNHGRDKATDGRPEMLGAKHAFVYYLRLMGLAALTFLEVLALLMLAMDLAIIISNALDASMELFGYSELLPLSLLSGVLVNASNVFLLVMGIVMPTYLETMLNFGLTRRQNTYALLLVSALLTLGFALIILLVSLPSGGFGLLGSTLVFVNGWLSYLTGWFIVIGYQYRRVLTAFLTTAVGAALNFILLFQLAPLAQYTLVNQVEGSLAALGVSLLISLILIFAIIPLTSRIPIKV
ncbi:MAG: hypothetical protein LBK67_09460 [Coriobacteriales bacterium]|jgi:hypothetical protein|nr:hypothetical protein [Coriobacteriales bacterium]